MDGGNSSGTETCDSVESKYKDLADLQKYTISKSCAFELDNCHFDEDPPTMHTVAAMWQMIDQPCNQAIPEAVDWDPFCTNGGLLVNPGNAADSYLLVRLKGPNRDDRSSRTQMPFGSSGLSGGEEYAISAWINGLTATSTVEDLIDYSLTPCPL